MSEQQSMMSQFAEQIADRDKAHPCPHCGIRYEADRGQELHLLGLISATLDELHTKRVDDFTTATLVDIQSQLLDITTMLRRIMPLVGLAEKMTAEKSILRGLRKR